MGWRQSPSAADVGDGRHVRDDAGHLDLQGGGHLDLLGIRPDLPYGPCV